MRRSTFVTFERDALYKEVWEIPLSLLGPKYGLSDNGLRKACLAMDIPLPTRGHWAKVDAGEVIAPEPLPPDPERTRYTANVILPPEEGIVVPGDDEWVRLRVASEDLPENKIISEVPTRWHRRLIPIRDHVREQAKAYAKALKLAEEKKNRPAPRVWSPPTINHLELWRWKDGFLSGGVLRVKTETMERGLQILNALYLAADKRGFVWEDDKYDGARMKLDVARMKLSVRERSEIDGRARLAIVCERSFGSRFEIIDTGDQLIEDRLNDVFKRWYPWVAKGRQEERQAVRDRERSEAARIEREAAARVREEEARLLKEETERRHALMEEVVHFVDAENARQYVRHVLEAAGRAPSNALRGWADWALKVADDSDPTIRRVNMK